MSTRPVSIVTGGAGFIGAHVTRELLDRGHQVIVLDDLSGGFEENVPENATFIRGSITDTALVDRVFEQYGFDYVYHLAAYAAEGLSHFIRRYNYTNNLIGSVNLINASIRSGVKCFVFTSSIAVYGEGQVPLQESTEPSPEDPYGVAKYAVELDLRAARRSHGLDCIVFRPHNVYGEYQNIGDRYRNVIGIFMNQYMLGIPYTIFGDGTQTRAFTYISDVAPIIASSVEEPAAYNEVFNIGADTPYSVNALAAAVNVAMGGDGDPEVTHLPPRNEVQHAFSDHSKLRSTFSTPPSRDLEEGLSRMAAWANRVGARATEPFASIEVAEGLPESWNDQVLETA